MGACNFQISRITPGSSRQFHLNIGVFMAHLLTHYSTGQRLHCPDDSTCNYFTFDKSALLRHRQRRHGYKTRSTAPKNRNATKVPRASEGGIGASHHQVDSRNSDVTECPCLSSSDCRVDGTIDEMHISQDDRVPLGTVEQPIGSRDESLERHAISRFPISFTRTHLPAVSVNRESSTHLKHCSRCTCKHSRPITKGVSSDGVSCPVSMTYRHIESFSKKSFFTGPTPWWRID